MSDIKTVSIDGSSGEGGGQILRTSLTLACITGKRLHIENIRAARRRPGLARQHLSCVEAACRISEGKCTGAKAGSKVLDFLPGPVRSGDYSFDIGSAGSASLVIQTVLPALFPADGPSKVTVTGGTHNPWAPPYDFLAESFFPAIEQAGFKAHCKLIKHGFYPAGGGEIQIDIEPWKNNPQAKLYICEPEEKIRIYARIYTAKLSAHIALKQKKLLQKRKLKIDNIENTDVTDSVGPGNCIMLLLHGRRTTVFTAFGKRGKPSEEVVGEVISAAESYLAGSGAVDSFLADQLLIFMAITGAGCFTTNELSGHLSTNIQTIKRFLDVDFDIEPVEKSYKITCRGL
jgi:RNA 3'-terminal phosphate cyclase (ATP)